MIGHSSRDPQGVKGFRHFAARAHEAMGVEIVEARFLKFADRKILDIIERYVQQGATQVTLPHFLLVPTGHQKNDVPSAVHMTRLHYPEVTFHYAAPVGIVTRPFDILDERLGERVLEAEQQTSAHNREETALLLVDRGGTDPDGNSEVFKIERLLWESRGHGWAEVCFVNLARSAVRKGITRCVTLGAKRVIVGPYFFRRGPGETHRRTDAGPNDHVP